MTKYILKRVARSLITMFIIITVLFTLLRFMPVEGYFENYDKLNEVQIQAKLNTLGLNDPLPKQLLRFYQQIFRGELGVSNKYRIGVSINEIIADQHAYKPLYDISGRRVNRTNPGQIYIQDGKKFIAR